MAPRPWRVVASAIGAIGIVLLVFWCGPAWRRVAGNAAAERAGRAQLQIQIESARREGIPLTAAEYPPDLPPPREQDAAPLYESAGGLLWTLNAKDAVLAGDFAPFGQARPGKQDANRRYLTYVRPVFDRVESAASHPACFLPEPLNLDGLDTSSVAGEMVFFAKLAYAKAGLETHDGDPLKAVGTLTWAARMCGQLSQSHSGLTIFDRAQIEIIVTHGLGNLLRFYGDKPNLVAAVLEAIKALGPMPDLVRVVEAENLSVLDGLSQENLSQTLTSGGSSKLDRDARYVAAIAREPGMADRFRARQIEATRRIVAEFKSDGSDWIHCETAVNAIMKEYTDPPGEAQAFMRFGPMDQWGGMIDLIARLLSVRRVLTQATEVLRVWNGTGKFPTRLPITGVASLDPLAERSYRYSASPGGFSIVGVGAKGADHGGKLSGAGLWQSAKFDIGFRFLAGGRLRRR